MRSRNKYLIPSLLHSHGWINFMKAGNGIKNNSNKNQISLISKISIHRKMGGILIHSSGKKI